ncbi:MAG: nucleoside phosphorylase [Oscillospiraceae bacterium]|nr:nucleoside phosphorylase [Oscillospiraceae bacterium]
MATNKETAALGVRQYHINMVEGDVGDYVLLPGDPFRTDIVAKYLDDAQLVMHKREHKTYTGFYKGVRVSVTSTGMGCPSTAIALEELANIGARVFIRLGTSAGLKAEVHPGDLLITTASMKNDGTSRMYVPECFPAAADLDLTYLLVRTAKEMAQGTPSAVHFGVTATDDAFYAETPEWIEKLVKLGCTNVEMESGAIFTISHRRDLRSGCICACAANLNTGEEFFGKENTVTPPAVELETRVALETFYRYDQLRKNGGLLKPLD